VDVHVDSVKARVCTLSECVPLVDTDEAFKDGNIGTVAFSVTGDVTDHVVGFDVTVGTQDQPLTGRMDTSTYNAPRFF
jgi:hypothetical protein